MHLILLIIYVAINLSQGQVIHHFLPNHEEHLDKLRWPSLNIIMHVPTHNGTLKRVPIYTSPTAYRRYMDYKSDSNRRFYSNNIKNTRNNTAVTTETEWVMGRPPGVKFQRQPGVNYANFHPGQNSPALFNNTNMASTHFNAQRKNKTAFMNVDVAMQPDTNDYYLKRISPDNITTILYNNTNQGNKGTVTRKMYSNNYQGYQRPNDVYARATNDVQNILNDVFTKYNQNDTTNKQNNRANQYEPSYNRLPHYKNYQPYSAYPPTFRPITYYQQNIRKRPQNYTMNRYNENTNKQFNKNQTMNRYNDNINKQFNKNQTMNRYNENTNKQFNKNQNTATQKQNVPFFWDGKSPMNISITQRDPRNQTLFSYSFDPMQLLPKNITKSISDHRVYTRKRSRSKDTKEASNRRPKNDGNTQIQDDGPQKISLNAPRFNYMGHPVIEYDLRSDESSEFLGYFPKDKPRIENQNDLLTMYSNNAEPTFAKQNDDDVVVTTDVQHDDNKYDHHDNNKNMLVISPMKPNQEETNNKTGKYILMQLKKPLKTPREPMDFKSKVEPLIITSIYRQFLADLKRNLSTTGTAKQKLHFSFKLGPGYFNKELARPTNMSIEESFDSDDTHFDKYE